MSKQELARPLWLLPLGHLHPLWWVGIGAGLIWIDYIFGPNRQFPAMYVIPVSLAAWYSGRWPALGLAVAMPLVHAAFLVMLWTPSGDLTALLAAVAFRGVVIIVMALWFSRLAEHERQLHRYVQRLEGLLPICAFCKSIRNKAGDWEPIESFISDRSEAQFSHSFCPSCGKEHYPDFDYDGAPSTEAEVDRPAG